MKQSRKKLDVSNFIHALHQTNPNLPFLIGKKTAAKKLFIILNKLHIKNDRVSINSRSKHKPSKIHQPKLFTQFKNFYGSMVKLLSYWSSSKLNLIFNLLWHFWDFLQLILYDFDHETTKIIWVHEYADSIDFINNKKERKDC